MARVIWTDAAQADVKEIRRYIAADSPAAAADVVRRLRSEARRLARYPQLGRTVPEYGDPAIREIIVAPYRSMYRFLEDRDDVQVLTVVHGARMLRHPPDGQPVLQV